MLWWDSVGAQMYLYFNDGNSSQWVPATNILPGPQGATGPSGPNTMPPGITDGSNAAAGQVGQFTSVTNTTLALTSGAVTSLATLNLGAGEWDVLGRYRNYSLSFKFVVCSGRDKLGSGDNSQLYSKQRIVNSYNRSWRKFRSLYPCYTTGSI